MKWEKVKCPVYPDLSWSAFRYESKVWYVRLHMSKYERYTTIHNSTKIYLLSFDLDCVFWPGHLPKAQNNRVHHPKTNAIWNNFSHSDLFINNPEMCAVDNPEHVSLHRVGWPDEPSKWWIAPSSPGAWSLSWEVTSTVFWIRNRWIAI